MYSLNRLFPKPRIESSSALAPLSRRLYGGVLPFLFLIKFNASVRVFWALSLRIVHLQEMLACKIARGLSKFLPLRGVANATESVSETISLSSFSSSSVRGGIRATIISGVTK